MSVEELYSYIHRKICYRYNEKVISHVQNLKKVCENCHFTGNYRGAADRKL